jgi:GT2 family glycosyltransferase
MKREPVWPVGGAANRTALRRAYRLHQLARERAPDRGDLERYARLLRRGGSLVGLARQLFSDDRAALEAAIASHSRSVAVPAASASERLATVLVALIEDDPATDAIPLLPMFHADGIALDDEGAYRWWVEENDARSDDDRARVRAMARDLPPRPRLSLLVAVMPPCAVGLFDTLASLAAQLHHGHETLVLLPGTLGRRPARRLARHVAATPGARIVPVDGPAALADLFNAGVRASEGDFVGLVSPADRLAETATFEVVDALARRPETRLVYSDEDAIDPQGRRGRPVLKPGWDPDAVLAQNQVGRLALFRRDVLAQCGGMRREFDAAAEYELMLRIGRALPAEHIQHIPSVLYHRMQPHVSRWSRRRTARRPEADRSPASPVAAHLRAAGVAATVTGAAPTRVVYALPKTPPQVSIVIPTRDRVDLLRPCLDGILGTTAYPALDVVIVDNDSKDPETAHYLDQATRDARVRVMRHPGAFNWAAINNRAVEAAIGDVVVMLNNDVEVIDPGWLSELAAQALRPEVGLVGAKLLYGDRRVQHAGIAVGPAGATVHLWRHAAEDDPGYMNFLAIARNVSAVTGACIAMRKTVFREVGGLEETHLPVTCSDTDLCFRVRARGYRVIWTPHARLIHAELSTRGSDEVGAKAERARGEQAHLRQTWGSWLDEDPYLSPHLVRSDDGARMFARRRIAPAWRR